MAAITIQYYYLTLGLLGLCVLVGLVIAYRFQREVNEDLAPPTRRDLFDPLEKAFYSGLMDKDEFERIRESMERQKVQESASTPMPLTRREGRARSDRDDV